MELGAADFQLIALLPGNLQRIFGNGGAEYFGIVQAADGGWCWSFHADGVDQRSKVFPSKTDAEVDLSWIHFSLYPIWLNPGERAGHLCNLMRRRDEHRALAIPDQIFGIRDLLGSLMNQGPRNFLPKVGPAATHE